MVSGCAASCFLAFWLVGCVHAHPNQDHVLVLCLLAKLRITMSNSCINAFDYFYRSHNFRPSYMRLRASMLHARLNVKCILAMTATATIPTLHDVMFALAIPQTNLIRNAQLRDNLQLSVSLSGNRQVFLIVDSKIHSFLS